MSRLGVVPTSSRRSRLQPTLDIRAPPPTDAELAADIMRVKTRLARRAALKASAENVAKSQEVPRVARQRWQHASTLESKESSLKGKYPSYPASEPCMTSCSLHISHSAYSSCAT